MTDLCDRDVVRYAPSSMYRRDGYAVVRVVNGQVKAKDTFDQNDTALTDEELASAEVLFNENEFADSRFIAVRDYHPADVWKLRTRKGMMTRTWLRKGAIRLGFDDQRRRWDGLHEEALLQARTEMLAPLLEQSYGASPMPAMSIEETGALSDIVHWVQRSSRTFNNTLEAIAKDILADRPVSPFAGVLADEDHHELVRARHALDEKLAEVRAAA